MIKALCTLSLVIVCACIAVGLFIPNNLICDRVPAYEGAAAGTMKSSIFSSQVQFQMACYLDDNGNGIGEYGFINHLCGDKVRISGENNKSVSLLGGQLKDHVLENGDSESSRYIFRIYLPDGRGGMYTIEDYRKDDHKEIGADLREKFYLVLAWPEELNVTGRRIYAMGPDGQLRSTNLIKERDAFLANPGWHHFYQRLPDTIEEINAQWPADKWPYYSK